MYQYSYTNIKTQISCKNLLYCYLSFLNCTLLDCDRKINGEKNSNLNIKHFLLLCILQQQWQIRSFLEYLRSWFCVFFLRIRKGSEKLDAERYMENILVTKCKPFIAKAWKLCHECVSVMLNALPQTGLLCHVYDISHHTIYYIPLNWKIKNCKRSFKEIFQNE